MLIGLEPVTEDTISPQLFKLLAHDLRWQMLLALSIGDLRVQELAAISQQPQNLVSYHLGRLLQAGLLREHRSIADGREVYYSLDIDHLKDMYFVSGRALHPGLGANQAVPGILPPSPPLRVLFLCTHNSARSQMAEGLMNLRSQGYVLALSAGLEPTMIHPMTIQVMDELGIDTAAQYAKPLAFFQDQEFDALVSVCDRSRPAASSFPLARDRLHWSLPDPLEAQGGYDQQLAVFRSVAAELDSRIGHLLARLHSEHDSEHPHPNNNPQERL
jgi:protein-tyrosine-phosphatase/DNA-binding transcriptional ArsR family regulator